MKKIRFLTQEDFNQFSKSIDFQDKSGFSIIDKKTEQDLTILIFSELRKVKDNDRSLIILCNAFFELVINHLVKKNLKTQKKILKDNRAYSYSVKLTLLYEAGFIEQQELDKLNYLRKIRNDFSHNAFSNLEKYDLKKISAIQSSTYFSLVFLTTEIYNRHSTQLIELCK